MYGVEYLGALLFFEDLGEDGDNPLALEVGGVEEFDQLEDGVEIDAGLAHKDAHALDGIVVIEHQESIIISSRTIPCPAFDYINYIHNYGLFYHCSALVVLAILRLDLVQFVLEVLGEQLVVVFGLFDQVGRGVAEGGTFVGVLLLELRQFRLLLFH